MKETGRKDYGMTLKGAVTLIAFEGQAESPGGPVPEEFQVRHGVRTVGNYATRREAELVAGALVGQAPEPEPAAEPEEKPAPARAAAKK